MTNAPQLAAGRRLGHYRLLGPLGRGGMGEVYAAEDLRLGREVAIKVLPAELGSSEQERLARLEREARALAALNHPNIVTVHAVEESDGLRFLVMERVVGESLDAQLARGPLPPACLMAVARELADGLAGAHARGIVHRDLKPANVMCTESGRVKILDFGLARLQRPLAASDIADAPTQPLSIAGQLVGSLPYMAPEELKGQPADARSDVFAVGVMLYELATGHHPFAGASAGEVISGILRDEPAPAAARAPGLPPAFAGIIDRCLQKDPERRYASAAGLLADLEAIGEGAPAAAATVAAVPTAHRGRRRLLAAAGVALALAAALGWLQLHRDTSDRGHGGPARTTTLAVLPFSNLRPDPATDFLGLALADEVIERLSFDPELVLRPASAVRRYAGRVVDPAAVAHELDVDYVLVGSFQREGDRLRLSVELVDSAARQASWSDRIEVEYVDAFSMQDRVASSVVAGLPLRHAARKLPRPPVAPHDPLAYEYYLKSLAYPRTVEGQRLAVAMARQAVALDPSFAAFHDQLGESLLDLNLLSLGEVDVAEVRRELERALALDPARPAALALLGRMALLDGHAREAVDSLRRAIAVQPGNAEAHGTLGELLRIAGQPERAIAEIEEARRLDPTSRRFDFHLATAYLAAGRPQDAFAALDRSPDDPFFITWKAYLLYRSGHAIAARPLLEQVVGQPQEAMMAAWARQLLAQIAGDRPAVLAEGRRLETGIVDGENDYYTGISYCWAGDREDCLRLLRRGVDRGFWASRHYESEPWLAPVRQDPRFVALLADVHSRAAAFRRYCDQVLPATPPASPG